MRRSYVLALFLLILTSVVCGCRSKESGDTGEAEMVELKDYETIVSVEDAILAVPYIIRYHPKTNTLFVYDGGKSQVLEINLRGEIVTEFGRAGRGPGEFQRANNLFVRDSSLYVVDDHQFLIHEFNLSGVYTNSIDYGAMGGVPLYPAPPFFPSMIRAEEIDNQPVVTLGGNILLSTVLTVNETGALYQLRDHEGKLISHVGEIPPGSVFEYDRDRYGEAIEERWVPDFYKPRAFPIPDRTNPEEFFFVYSAIGKIAKYDRAGNKLWGKKVQITPELESYTRRFFEISERFASDGRISLNKYVTGRVGVDGELYLGLGTIREDSKPFVWIHQFNNYGDMVKRYKLISKRVNLAPVFDIDFSKRRIFVVTREGEIRAYSF